MAPVVDLKKNNDSELYFNQITGRVRQCYVYMYQCSKKKFDLKKHKLIMLDGSQYILTRKYQYV